jgi:beta-lactam-binding protein with PASTA domain
MTRTIKYLSNCIIVLLVVFAACTPPKVLFSVVEGKPLDDKSEAVLINRGDKKLPGKKNLKLEAGDIVQIADSVDGTGIRSFNTVSTVHGPATLVVAKDYLEQKSGIALHEATRGKLLIPDMSILHEGAAYLVVIEEKTIDLIVFDGRILVSPGMPNPPWKPFYVESRQRRKIWRDGRLAPNQPLGPDDLNTWIDNENQLLMAGQSSTRMVPCVLTLPAADAEGLVAAAEFPVNHLFTQEGEDELGAITKQAPSGGRRVKAGNAVAIYERARPVVVPNVFGLSFGAAKDLLEKAGLAVEEIGETITRSVEPGMVNTQKPSADVLIAEGSTITLTIEAVSVAVPGIIGMTVEDAGKTLGALTLAVDSTQYDVAYSGLPKVIAQSPLPNTFVLPESVVKVRRLAQGFVVPNVVGKTSLDATNALTAQGFQIGASATKTSDSVAAGLVVSQVPAAGSVSGKEIPVILTISKGK